MKKYLVFLYQYNTMKRPKLGAVLYSSDDAFDLLPPTVIWHTGVEARSRREAIAKMKERAA